MWVLISDRSKGSCHGLFRPRTRSMDLLGRPKPRRSSKVICVVLLTKGSNVNRKMLMGILVQIPYFWQTIEHDHATRMIVV